MKTTNVERQTVRDEDKILQEVAPEGLSNGITRLERTDNRKSQSTVSREKCKY